jgi:arabinosaccharide transport system substrate-binding protein
MKKLGMLMVLMMALSVSLFAGGVTESAASGPTELSLWTFQQAHLKFYNAQVERWNAEYPDRQIVLKAETYPFADMHNKLLIALQSGVGAPDIVDIEISKYPNFLRGKVQLVPMNDYVEPVLDQFVTSRLEIYAKGGTYYGLPSHVGATVMYYNVEIMEAAGVDIDSIETWEDYVEAGEQVVAKTGKKMTTIEVTDNWSYMQMVSQAGSDLIGPDGSITIDDEINNMVLQFQYDLIYKYKIAVPTPGGKHHAEEYYGAMNNGDFASVWMPMWYMGRFTDYMPDLKGKIAIRPLPRFTADGNRSAGMGGTGTVVTNQADNIELAKEFLAYAKLSEEGNEDLWTILGFDPPRWSVWDNPVMNEQNAYTEYFVNDDIFGLLLEVKDEINPINITELFPLAVELIDTQIPFQVLSERSKTPAQALRDAAAILRANQ